MKANLFVRSAAWLMDQDKSEKRLQYFAGDLLEELHAGRSPFWFFYQLLVGLILRFPGRILNCLLWLSLSSGWSLLYPLWRPILAGKVPEAYWSTHLIWPLSSLAMVIFTALPALLFVWSGFMAYVVARGTIRQMSLYELTRALLVSSGTLLAMSLLILRQIRSPELALECIPQRLGDDRGTNCPSLRRKGLGRTATRNR